MNPTQLKRVFLPIFLAVILSGCGTLAPRARVPMRSFPPSQPSVVRLPVEIVFPSGGDVFQHAANFLKAGVRQLLPNMYTMSGLDIKPRVTDLWEKMQEPIFLDKGVWLLIRPETLSIGIMPIEPGQLLTAHTVLEMSANPEVVFGKKPNTIKKVVPQLSFFKSGPPVFEAVSNVKMSYAEANNYLHDPRLNILDRLVPGSGERKLRIKDIHLSGSDGQVVVRVKVEYSPPIINLGDKPAKMTIYLRGTPRYRPDKQMFDLPDLNFDIKTSDFLVQMANWIFNSDIKNELRKAARLPVGPKVDQIKARLDVVLNRQLGPFAKLVTHVDSFKVLDGFADDKGIELRVSLRGRALMQVKWN
ncbi:MAG TPA: DUF4403 family protein [bacterium]|jgi:hypothetical protein|nr:DUF4403 family protein [bacterium]